MYNRNEQEEKMDEPWKDGNRVGKLEVFVEVMKVLDEHIYGPYNSKTMRLHARQLRTQIEQMFVEFGDD